MSVCVYTDMCAHMHMPIINARKNMLDEWPFYFFSLYNIMLQGAFPKEQA